MGLTVFGIVCFLAGLGIGLTYAYVNGSTQREFGYQLGIVASRRGKDSN